MVRTSGGVVMEVKIGTVTHYYNKISVAVLDLMAPIQVGDRITILGRTTEFDQRVESLEIDHQKVDRAEPGQDVALKVWDYVRKGDQVYKADE
jgi:translation elongation factor EF-1alpha